MQEASGGDVHRPEGTAAPGGGAHGVFGNIVPVLADQTHDEQ